MSKGRGITLTADDCASLEYVYMQWLEANHPLTDWDEVQATQALMNKLTIGAGRPRIDINEWNLKFDGLKP